MLAADGQGALQRQPIHQSPQLRREPAGVAVCPVTAGQGSQATGGVAGQPALRRAQRHPGAAGRAAAELDEAARIASRSGATWADTGRDSGMSRQSANERWSSRL